MTYKRVKPCKKCLHYKACITANPDMVKKTFECEYFEDTDLFKKEIKSEAIKEFAYKAVYDIDTYCEKNIITKPFVSGVTGMRIAHDLVYKRLREMVGEEWWLIFL